MRIFITHYNKVFWGLFLAAVAVMFTAVLGSLPILDILLALILIVIALHKVEEDMLHHRLGHDKVDNEINMRRVNHLLGNHFLFTRNLRDSHEFRLHNLDTKRVELDGKIEQKYREIVRKVLEVENELNRISKTVKNLKTPKRTRRKKL